MFKENLLRIITLIVLVMLVGSVNVFANTEECADELTKEEIASKFEEINSKYEIDEPFSEEDADELTKEEIALKFEEINSKYEIDEPFSEEDVEFVKKYAKKIEQDKEDNDIGIMGYVGDSFNVSGTSSDGLVSANISGNGWSDMGYINHSYGAEYETKATRNGHMVTKIEAQVDHTAFGLVGSDGNIGKVYSNSLKGSASNVSSYRFKRSEKYTAAALYSTTSVKSDIHYQNGSSAGSFTIRYP
ncbi:hypothetical protein [Anaerovirgula multivorans]|nr:hypothetical protein [Anaerovirgula multivorans]